MKQKTGFTRQNFSRKNLGGFTLPNFVHPTQISKKFGRARKNLGGFTLIELLLVTAIIALLVTITLVSLGASRLKAKDAMINEAMFTLRGRAETSFSQDGNYDAVCNDTDNTLTDSGDFGLIENNIKNNNGGVNVKCYESLDKKAYAAWTPLMSFPGGYWCIDSALANRGLSSEPPAGSTVCP